MSKECWRLTISGKVQGVSFRACTQDKARELGLTGWVSNRQDGGVEVVAEGEEDALKALRDWCYDGPPGASVSDVKREVENHSGRYSDFLITADI